jgi:hypothetical protein
MFLVTIVKEWGIDGGRRVPNHTDGNLYILNTNRMFELREGIGGDPQMLFFDNPADSRCGGAKMRTDVAQATVTNIINEADDAPATASVTVDVYPDNDLTATTVSRVFPKAAVAYCYPYGNVQSHAKSWMVIAEDGWNMRRVLVNHSWIPLNVLLNA